MKKWNALLGISFPEELKRDGSWNKGCIKSDNLMFIRDKWHVLGRGRERIILDEKMGMWVFEIKMRTGVENLKELHYIDIRIKKA